MTPIGEEQLMLPCWLTICGSCLLSRTDLSTNSRLQVLISCFYAVSQSFLELNSWFSTSKPLLLQSSQSQFFPLLKSKTLSPLVLLYPTFSLLAALLSGAPLEMCPESDHFHWYPLVQAIVSSLLCFFNSLLSSLPSSALVPLQSVLHATAWMIPPTVRSYYVSAQNPRSFFLTY